MSRPVVLQDGSGVVVTVPGIGHMLVFGETVPTNGSKDYATGCMFIQTDGGANTALWRNEGTSSSSSFVAVTTGQPLDATLTSLAALDFTGNALKNVRVNAGETAFELAAGGGGGLTNFTDTLADAAPNDVVPVAALSAYGVAADIDIAIVPKGYGAITAQIADGTAAGGDKRGEQAVDFQMYRAASTQVASGTRSVVAGGHNNTSSYTYSVVSGGYGNIAGGDSATVGGGKTNTAGNTYSTVGGGLGNTASGLHSVASGGHGNTASGNRSLVVGGYSNTASGLYSIVGGGNNNTASGIGSTIVSGNSNAASATRSVVVGGDSNTSGGSNSFVGCGSANTASGANSCVSGGSGNTASGELSFIGGGYSNTASGNYGVVSGGKSHTASGDYGVVAGGAYNTASGNYSTVNGGDANTASGYRSTVSGGNNNTANSLGSTVSGGRQNLASSNDTAIGGGRFNTASGSFSVVSGGYQATTRGITGMSAIASGQFAAQGDSQEGGYRLRKQTTDATANVSLTADAGAQSGTNQVILPNNSTYVVRGIAVAREPATGDSKTWEFSAGIRRGANAAATAMIAACTPTVIAQDAGAAAWALDVSADTTNGGLQVRATGEAAHTIQWVASIWTCETVG